MPGRSPAHITPAPTQAPARAQGWGATLWRRAHNPRARLAVIVLVPTIIWFVVLQFAPIFEAMWFAFFHVDLANMSLWNSPFDGLLRFQHLFDPELNPEFWPGALHSAIWTVLQFLFVIPLGLLLSLAMARVGRGRRFYQIAIFVPVVTPLVAIGLMMGKVFDPEAGPANGLLRALGLPTSAWFHDPTIALPLAAAIGAWRWMGLYVLILTAGILNIPLFIALIACLMIPSSVIALPLYVNLVQLGLGRNLGALIVVGLWSPFGIFTLRQFMEGIPAELLDAARIDGASEWRIVAQVLTPLCTSALAVLVVYAFMKSWDNFLLPTILFQWILQPQNWTLPLLAAGGAGAATPLVSAVVVLMTLPALIIFVTAMRYFIRDITVTSTQS